jgi:hypothetical protein
MSNNRFAQFNDTEGYKTYANAQKRGEEIAAKWKGEEFRWVVIALPNGRFAPCIVYNGNLPIGPLLGLRNVCHVN